MQIAELDRKAWSTNRRSEFIPDGDHAWKHWVDGALVFCAKEEGEIVGAVLAFPYITGEYLIHKIIVNEDSRGKGIGTKLFEVLLDEIDELEAASFITVDPINEVALKLYEKYGFGEKTYIKDYYRSGEDRYVLTRSAKRR